MNIQTPIFLSLGSNLDNRLSHLQNAVDLLHQTVGTVLKISSVYETPAWGFESAPFLNIVLLMHTYNKPTSLLRKILKIEQSLGRERTSQKGYQARTIDIDILSFGAEMIATTDLQIPHLQIPHRRFVLMPWVEIDSFWIHPATGLTTRKMLEQTTDVSDCKLFGELKNPWEYSSIKNCNYIAIEGNIGAGKTTLVHKMAQDFNAKVVMERFADNPFLPKFYKDQNRYAFPLEMSFLADRYQQITDDLSQFDLFKDFVISDYFIFKSLIFAKVTLAEDEFRLYKTMFDIIYKEIPTPDLYVYLYQNT